MAPSMLSVSLVLTAMCFQCAVAASAAGTSELAVDAAAKLAGVHQHQQRLVRRQDNAPVTTEENPGDDDMSPDEIFKNNREGKNYDAIDNRIKSDKVDMTHTDPASGNMDHFGESNAKKDRCEEFVAPEPLPDVPAYSKGVAGEMMKDTKCRYGAVQHSTTAGTTFHCPLLVKQDTRCKLPSDKHNDLGCASSFAECRDLAVMSGARLFTYGKGDDRQECLRQDTDADHDTCIGTACCQHAQCSDDPHTPLEKQCVEANDNWDLFKLVPMPVIEASTFIKAPATNEEAEESEEEKEAAVRAAAIAETPAAEVKTSTAAAASTESGAAAATATTAAAAATASTESDAAASSAPETAQDAEIKEKAEEDAAKDARAKEKEEAAAAAKTPDANTDTTVATDDTTAKADTTDTTADAVTTQ